VFTTLSKQKVVWLLVAMAFLAFNTDAYAKGTVGKDLVSFPWSSFPWTLTEDADISVVFVSENAGYKNTFGWYDASQDPTNPANRHVIWENASHVPGAGSGPDEWAGDGTLLMPGDKVFLGTFSAGTQLSFFLTANGYNDPNGPTYFADTSLNSDGASHIVVNAASGIMSWEDQTERLGSKWDYNDLRVRIKTQAPGVPEPETWALMLVLMGALAWRLRQRQPVSEETAFTA